MFYDLYSGTPQCIHIHSIVNSLVSCNVGKIPETWSVRRMKYTYYIYTHNYPTSTSSSSCFEVQGTWIRDISPTISAVSPASGASSVMPDQGRDHESFRAPGPRFCRASRPQLRCPMVPLTPMLGTVRQNQAELKAIGIPKGTWI